MFGVKKYLRDDTFYEIMDTLTSKSDIRKDTVKEDKTSQLVMLYEAGYYRALQDMMDMFEERTLLAKDIMETDYDEEE